MQNNNSEKIILDIDNALTIPAQDTDDAVALALALVSPELELLGEEYRNFDESLRSVLDQYVYSEAEG